MKHVTKICLIVCAVFAALGLLLLGIGTVMGARPSEYLDLAHVGNTGLGREIADELDDLRGIDDDRYDDDYDDRYDDDRDDIGSIPGHHEEIHDDHHGDLSTIGGTAASDTGGEYDQTFTDAVSKLDIAVSAAQIELVLQEENAIRVVSDNADGTLQCWVEGRELHVENYTKLTDQDGSYITVYYPAGLAELDMELAAGTFLASELRAGEVSLDVAMGECQVGLLAADREADLSVAMGTLAVGSVEAREISGECGAGELTIGIAGAYEDYNYEIEAGAGEIKLAGDSYSGIGIEKHINNRAAKEADLSCGMGTLTVDFVK